MLWYGGRVFQSKDPNVSAGSPQMQSLSRHLDFLLFSLKQLTYNTLPSFFLELLCRRSVECLPHVYCYSVTYYPTVSRWGEIFGTHPDRLWGPPSLLDRGVGSYPGVKRPGSGVDHLPPSSAEVEGRVELYTCFPSGPSWPVLGLTLPLLYFTLQCPVTLYDAV
jgi:hypothetical protein